MKKFAALVAVLALVAFAAPAFAANPFMDVPMNHWAYDAVSQLASRGVVSGYPDGAFKGEWKATRYEMASVVARALAYVDMNKASKQDLELLKKLVVEFKDELDALGVKVDELDARVAVLESDIGGWSLSGEFRFDAKWADQAANVYTNDGDVDFTMSRYRLWIKKRVDDKVTFIGRVGGNALTWERYYLSVVMPWDSTLWVGRWLFDWETNDNLWNDNDALFGDRTMQGFFWTKNFAMGNFDLFVSHTESVNGATTHRDVNGAAVTDDFYEYGARVALAFNEQFGMSFNYMARKFDVATINDQYVWWVAPYVNFTPDIALRGAYFSQSIDQLNANNKMWKAILDISQEATGFTSVWLEYADVDQNFYGLTASGIQGNTGQAGLMQYDDLGSPMTPNLGEGADSGSVIFVRLDQKWNDKWATFQRWGKTSMNTNNTDTSFWTFGVKYWYTPALSFELAYDDVSYDAGLGLVDDTMIRFRTYVSF
jgi:hypothetical protein